MNSLGALQTSMNVTKTRMMQRMGKEGRSYSEHYLNARASVKDTEAAYKEEVSRMKKLLSSLEAFEESLGTFGNNVHEVAKSKYTSDSNQEAWEYALTVHSTLAAASRSLRQVIYSRMTDLQQFLDTDLHATEKARALARNSKVELDSAEDSLNSLSPNSSTNDIFRIYFNHTKANEKFDHLYRESLHIMTDALYQKDFRITSAWTVLMQELGVIIQQTFSHFDTFEKHMDALRAYEHEKVEEFDVVRQERMKERSTRHMITLRSLEDDLIRMLMHPELALIGAIGVASTGNEKIIQMVVKILDSYGKLVSLLNVAVTREVQTTQDHSTLFRGNSPSTKLMTAFTRILGKGYLDEVLKPFVEEMVEEDPQLYEVDPAKTEGDVEENMQRLLKRCQEILDRILGSLPVCPPSFRMVTKHLQREVVKRFPDSKNTCVGGFLFLRFLCPVLMSPDVLGLIEGAVDKKKRRALTLICKALQNLSNNIQFGKKESYMFPVNTFLDDNMARTNNFFEDFVDVSDDIEWEPLAKLEDVRKNEVKQLHCYTKDNIAKIGRYLLGTSSPEMVMEIVRLVADLDSAYEYGDEHPELCKHYVPTATSSLEPRNDRLRLSKTSVVSESTPNLPALPPRNSSISPKPERSAAEQKRFAPPTRQRSLRGMRSSSYQPPPTHPLPPSSNLATQTQTQTQIPTQPQLPTPVPSSRDRPTPVASPRDRPTPVASPRDRPTPAASPRDRPISAYQAPPTSAPPPPVQPRPPPLSNPNAKSSPALPIRLPPPSRQPLLARNRPSEDVVARASHRHQSARYPHLPPNHKPLPPTPPPKKSPER